MTYTLVWFVILSNIPSGKKLRGLSKMVLKNKISTHYTSDDFKSSQYHRPIFFLKYVCCFLLTSSRPKKKKMFSSWNLSPFQSFKENQSIFQFTHNCSSTSLSKALLSIVLIALLWRNLQKKETFRWSSILNQTAFDEKRRKGNPFSN